MNTLDFLRANEHKSEVNFVSKAQYLKDNWPWLRYSYAIAIKIRSRMKELGITQKELALLLGCTQQHISVLLGGKSNMTLETMAKLEHALSFDLIGKSLQEFNYSVQDDVAIGYLNASSESEPIPSDINISELVDSYKTRKKKGPKSIK